MAERPTDVRVERSDGTVTYLELAYVGCFGGIDTWEVTTNIELSAHDRIAIGVLPGRTEIKFPTRWDDA